MKKTYSHTKKAVEERQRRSRRTSERRFSETLKEFLKHKYGEIYTEYVELFNQLNGEHPSRRNLSATKAFREWKTTNPPPTISFIPQIPSTEIISEALRDTFAQDINTSEHLFEETQDENTRDMNTTEQQPVETPDENVQHLPAPSEDNQASDILDELAENNDMRNFLEQPVFPEDEGIGLNIFDEIEFDIEPFDYNIDVEPYDY